MIGFTDKVALGRAQIEALMDFTADTIKRAGAATLPFFRSELNVDNKLATGEFDPVTEADRAAERVIRDAISAAYPQHGILGEEFGYQPGNGLTWIIDPIDGTRAFMTGMLHWGVLVGLFDGQDVVVGAMYQPFTDELFIGDGQAAYWRRGQTQQGLRASLTPSLEQSSVATTAPILYEGVEAQQLGTLQQAVQLSRIGGDCYNFAAVALGTLEFATDARLNAYDIAGLVPVIRGAGGVVTTFDGGNPCLGGTVLASANPTLHEAALALIGADAEAR